MPEGFEVTLWATSPLLFNPTNMDFDSQGRLYVAEGVNYRGKKGRRPEGDRVVVLEDTTGSGRSDKSSVFVQDTNLEAPLGVAVLDDKVVVSQPPDLLVYHDENRDGKFDPASEKVEALLTGFGGRQHDHSLHSVTAGPDGLWSFSQASFFQNISIAAPSVLNETQLLWGQADARIRNLTFENLTIAGKFVRGAEFFKTNEFVEGLKFAPRHE